MSGGEIITALTVWVAVAAYAAGSVGLALGRGRRAWDRAARLLWTVACLALLAHVACAFHFYHGWSQRAAYLDTARQTFETTGLEWGGGVYLNYLLLAFWTADVAVWWARGTDSYRRRPLWLGVAWHLFLLFIIFNATVVFTEGPARAAGLVLCLSVCLAWTLAARARSGRRRTETGWT